MRSCPSQKTETTFNIGEVWATTFAFDVFSKPLNYKAGDGETIRIKRIDQFKPFTILESEFTLISRLGDGTTGLEPGFKITILTDNKIWYTECSKPFFKNCLYKIT